MPLQISLSHLRAVQEVTYVYLTSPFLQGVAHEVVGWTLHLFMSITIFHPTRLA